MRCGKVVAEELENATHVKIGRLIRRYGDSRSVQRAIEVVINYQDPAAATMSVLGRSLEVSRATVSIDLRRDRVDFPSDGLPTYLETVANILLIERHPQ